MSDGVASIGSFLSFSASAPATKDVAGFAALTPWTDWDEPTSIGEVGASDEVLTFNPVKSGNTEKRLGASNSGQQAIEAPFVSGNAAQGILKAAKDGKTVISVRETLAEGSVLYYQAYVPTYRVSAATTSSIQMLMTSLEVTGAIVYDDA